VKRDEDGQEFFVHYSNIMMDKFKTLKAGQVVSFTIGSNDRGPQAEQVEVIGEPEEEEALDDQG